MNANREPKRILSDNSMLLKYSFMFSFQFFFFIFKNYKKSLKIFYGFLKNLKYSPKADLFQIVGHNVEPRQPS